MMQLDIAHAQTIGQRAEQQDAAAARSLGTGERGALLILADGLGGHASGAEAARIVVETFTESASDGSLLEHGTRRQLLNSVLLSANHRIHEATDPGHGQRSMASTAVAAIVSNGTVRWISVGDSHLFVCRKGRLTKLNADHSQAGMMLKHGYAPNDAAVLNARSVLVSALTGRDIEVIDNPAHDIALEQDDVVLLASDGLNTLSDADIAVTIDKAYEKGAEAICKALLDEVKTRDTPRQDNATVVVARVIDTGKSAASGKPQNGANSSEITATDVPTLPLQMAAETLSEPIGAGRPRAPERAEAVVLGSALGAAASAETVHSNEGKAKPDRKRDLHAATTPTLNDPLRNGDSPEPRPLVAAGRGAGTVLKLLLTILLASALAAGVYVLRTQ